VKFKENIIVKGNTLYRCNIFRCLRYMKDIVYLKITIWSTNNRLSNVLNVHTCSVARVDLVTAIIVVLHIKLVKPPMT
jgi:hypothetical protein